MLLEHEVIFDNIKNFRTLLKENASRGDIADAINNREILKIFYAGDDTINRGYRTIEPYAMGFIKTKKGSGDLAVRAWEQAGASDSYNDVGRWAHHPPRRNHEYFDNNEYGRSRQPGWRLFKLKGITSAFLTGKKFPPEGKNLRPLYNPNDKQLDVVVAVQPPSDVGTQSVGGTDSVDLPDEIQQKLSAFDAQTQKWNVDASDQKATLIKNVVALYDLIDSYEKRSPKNYDVFKRDDGRYYALPFNSKARKRVGDDKVIGNLGDLYTKFTGKQADDWDQDKAKFFKDQIRRAEIADKKMG